MGPGASLSGASTVYCPHHFGVPSSHFTGRGGIKGFTWAQTFHPPQESIKAQHKLEQS